MPRRPHYPCGCVPPLPQPSQFHLLGNDSSKPWGTEGFRSESEGFPNRSTRRGERLRAVPGEGSPRPTSPLLRGQARTPAAPRAGVGPRSGHRRMGRGEGPAAGDELPSAGRAGGGGRGPPRPYFLGRPRRRLPARPGEPRASPPAPMQHRRPPPPAPGPRGPRPAALLLGPWLLLPLALQGLAAPAEPGWRQDTELPPGLLEQAARAALHFFNFRVSSPSALRALAAVQEGRARVSARLRAGGHTCARPAAPPRKLRRERRWGPFGVVRPRPRSVQGGEGPVAAHSPQKAGLWGAVDFSQGIRIPAEEVHGETEEQAPKATSVLSGSTQRWLLSRGSPRAPPTSGSSSRSCGWNFQNLNQFPYPTADVLSLNWRPPSKGCRVTWLEFLRQPGQEPS